MNELDYHWLRLNERMMYQSIRTTAEEANRIYAIYNALTGQNKKPNGCGSCMRNTVGVVRLAYEKQKRTNV